MVASWLMCSLFFIVFIFYCDNLFSSSLMMQLIMKNFTTWLLLSYIVAGKYCAPVKAGFD